MSRRAPFPRRRTSAGPGRLESFPAWSADGKTLYFCAADRSWGRDQLRAIEDLKKVKYDLMRVPYDIEKDTWGAPEPVLTAAETGMSISEPRASPDGRYLLFCMSAYGGFPVYQPSSDLYLMDLRTRQAPAVGVQQRRERVVALLVEQFALDRLQQQARQRLARPAVLQLY